MTVYILKWEYHISFRSCNLLSIQCFQPSQGSTLHNRPQLLHFQVSAFNIGHCDWPFNSWGLFQQWRLLLGHPHHLANICTLCCKSDSYVHQDCHVLQDLQGFKLAFLSKVFSPEEWRKTQSFAERDAKLTLEFSTFSTHQASRRSFQIFTFVWIVKGLLIICSDGG